MTERAPAPAAATALARRLGPVLAVAGLLAAATVAATLASPQIQSRPEGSLVDPTELPTQQVERPTPPQQLRTVQMPDWLVLALQVLFAVALVALVGFLVWYLLRNRPRLRERASRRVPAAPGQQKVRDEVLAAVDAGLLDLDDSDTDPRRAVIACWVRLEQAAAAAGTPRQPGDTPGELVTRLLAGHRVSAAVLFALAEVYRLARYATHTVDAAMRDQARGALRQLRAELSGQPERALS